MRRSRAAVLQDAQEQLGDLFDAVVDAAPIDSATTLMAAADADVAGQVADAITATLQATVTCATSGRVTSCAALSPR